MKKYPLSKSRIIDGLSCDRKLWLKKHKKHLATPFSDHTKYLMRNGTEVGKIAHKLHQEGILVEGGWFDPETAKTETEKLIENGTPVLFEAAFMADGLLHLADIIINHGDQSIEIHEVKSTTSVKEDHYYDVAVQQYIAGKAGYDVKIAKLIYLDRNSIFDGTTAFFKEQDITPETTSLLDELDTEIPRLLDLVESNEEPVVHLGNHCEKCEFKEYCWRDMPEKNIFTIPRLNKTKANFLVESGIYDAEKIPENLELSELQREYVQLFQNGVTKIN